MNGTTNPPMRLISVPVSSTKKVAGRPRTMAGSLMNSI